MGMNLSVKHRILTKEQYEKLIAKELYFNNSYDLGLIDSFTAEQIRKSLWFDELEDRMKDARENRIFLEDEDSLTEYCEKNIILSDLYDCPITLQEFLDEDNCDGFAERTVTKYQIEDKEFYLLLDVYCGW